jgi:hypothetical protein
MFFNKSKKAKKTALKLLLIWSPAVCGTLGSQMQGAATRNKILFYLLGSSDYVCQSAKLGDEDFFSVTKEVLACVGFEEQEVWEALGKFARQDLTKDEFVHMMKGADHYQKWVIDNPKAPLFLAMELIGDE